MLQPQTAIQGVTDGKDVFLPYYLPLEAYNRDQTWVSKDILPRVELVLLH